MGGGGTYRHVNCCWHFQHAREKYGKKKQLTTPKGTWLYIYSSRQQGGEQWTEGSSAPDWAEKEWKKSEKETPVTSIFNLIWEANIMKLVLAHELLVLNSSFEGCVFQKDSYL